MNYLVTDSVKNSQGISQALFLYVDSADGR